MKNKVLRLRIIGALMLFASMLIVFVAPTEFLTYEELVTHPFANSYQKDNTAVMGSNTALDGEGTESSPYLITSADDWNLLVDSVLDGTTYAGKYFKLTEDITVTRGIGSADITSATAPVYAFSGTFDGDGHTLDFVPPANLSADYVAPFSIVENATIKNLKVTGKITANNNLSGLIGAVRGTLLAENVLSDVDVTGKFVSGFIGHGSAGDITLRSCAFTGDLKGDTVAGGLICWRGPTQWDGSSTSAVHMENCLFAGTASGAADFHPIGFTQQTNVTSGFSNIWSSKEPKNNGKGFYNFQYQGASFKSTPAVVTSDSISSAEHPWMGYHDIVAYPPVQGTFADALNAWTSAKTLALLTDVTTNSAIYVSSGEHTIDLNGYGIRMTDYDRVMTIPDGAALNISDSGNREHYLTLDDYHCTAVSDTGTQNISDGNGVVKVIGGYITGGASFDVGGGIRVCSGGTLVMDGGAIVGNVIYNYCSGGGLRIDGNANVTLSGKTQVIYNSTPDWGGAIAIDGTLTVKDQVEIRYNFGQSGIHQCGTMKLSGSPIIRDNVLSDSGSQSGDGIRVERPLSFDGPLTKGASISVALYQYQTGEFTSGWSSYMGDADPADYFTSEDSSYGVFLNSNGEAEIGTTPVASIIDGETTNNYGSFSDALNAWTTGSTLKLMSDVTTNSTIYVPSGEHTLDLNGYGIRMTGSNSVINVGDSATLDLIDSNTDKTHKFDVPEGAGLATLNESSGNYTVNGGYITGGNANPYGGGVRVTIGGKFNMYGGTIIGNNATSHGGGVSVSDNSHGASSVENFKMYGGAISYNTANWGGGIAIYGKTYIYETNIISNNTANSGGGGIELENNGILYMSGGTVTKNVVLAQNGNMWKGAGIHVPSGSEYHISGSAVVKDNYQGLNSTTQNNVFVRKEVSGKVIVDGTLTDDAKIGVGTNGDIPFVITSGYKTYMGNADPTKYFKSDNSNYNVYIDTNGEAEIAVPPVVSIINGATTTNYGSLSDAVNGWSAGSTLKLLEDVNVNSTVIVPSGTHTLDLNGHGIKMTGGESVFTVSGGATLTINDNEDNKGYISGGNVTSGGGAFTVDGASLVLNGGVITGNKTTGTSMGASAGAIYLKNAASFLMTGGEISGNTSSSQGGAICTDQTATTVDIAGGEIKNNTAAKWASAIWAGRHTNAKFIIRGNAKIIDNVSSEGAGTINVADTHNYIISGDPTIFGKSSSGSGQNTHLNLDGNNSGLYQKVELSGPLTNDTGSPKITICAIRNTLSSGVTYVFTENWSTYMGSADPAKYFSLDSSITGVKIVRKNGEAAIASSGDLYVTFNANGGTGSMDSQFIPSSGTTLTQNQYMRDGYDFVGWNTQANGGGTGYVDGDNVTLSGDLTLYAQWKEDTRFEGKGTQEDPYLIQSAGDWNTLSEFINGGGTKYNGKYFKLTNDISVTTVLGNRPGNADDQDRPFVGTFDGDNHVLTVNINKSGWAAPFAIAHNSTIKNLKVKGSVKSSDNHATGLVGASKAEDWRNPSTLLIQNVTVSVDVSCNSHVAGIVGHAHNAEITMENVVFDGSLNASSIQGGFIGWGGLSNNKTYTASFKDCLFAGTYKSGAAFHPVAFYSGQGTVILLNDFYTTSLGSGGNPITPTGDGQIKLLAVTVEKDGNVKYFADIATASSSENWTEGSTLKLRNDVTNSSTITVPSGKHILDLNGHTLLELSTIGKLMIGSGASSKADLTIMDSVGTGVIRHETSRPGSLIWVKEGSSLTLNGGTLEANSSSSPVIDFFQQKNASFTMNGGRITGTANNGAVRFTTNCVFTMTGGEISGLQTSTGVFDFSIGSGTINISGNPVVTNNTANGEVCNFNLPDGKVIVINGKLTEGADIGVKTANPAVFTSGWKAQMGEADPSKYFTSDNGDYIVKLDESGEAIIALPHTHSWNYVANGNVITATCVGEGNCDLEAQTLTLNVSDKTYDGQAVTATVVKSDNWTAYGLAEPGEIVYSGNKNVGTYTAGVTAGGATASAEFTVSPAALTVNADTKTKAYGEDDPVLTYTYTGLVSGDSISGALLRDTGDNVGTYAIRLGTLSAGDNYIIIYNGAALTITEADMTVTTAGHDGNYDGEAYGITVTAPEGAVVKFGTTAGEYTLNDSPKYTAAGTYTVYYNVIKANYKTVTGSETVRIAPVNAVVTITGKNLTVDYDGKEHTVSGYTATVDTPLFDVTKDFKFSGNALVSRTVAGTTNMDLKAEQFDNTNPNFNVTFNITDGYMKINKINATVTIIGNNGTADYDGKDHTVTGYTATADNALYDVTKDLAFSGNATASRTVAGTTNMGLKANQFTNSNANFNVTFDITDGYMKIDQINAVVTIIGNNGTADYDGKDHTVTGYTATADNALYDVTKDFAFSGNATALRKDAGTTAMGLKANQFANTNPNFKTVTFNVTDGYITINPINAVVTITGNNGTADYDGKDHTVTGYVATADTALYDVTKDFKFSGNATVSRTVAGTTDMGLKADQFTNTNPNFKTVTFNVTDGYITINKIDAVITITGNNGTVDYDGKDHTVTGYTATADTALYDVTKDFEFSGNATVSRTVAGTTDMGLKADQFTNTNPNFKTVTFNVTDGYMKINQINAVVTITGNNGTADYDGKDHTVTGYTATADTALFDVTKDFTFSGNATVSRTVAGTTDMGLKADQFTNTNPNFKTVTFNVTDGYMKINQINAVVTITGNNGTADYDGKDHTVTGYTATVDTALFDVTKDFAFSGNATVSRTVAGTTDMGLKANQFTNTNPNFKTVTFNVTDGYIKINQINAVVTITGNNGTADYDGKDHTVTGYVATADTALFDVTKDFAFSGNATVSRTVAGTTDMGLKADQFTNTNPNFKTVTFNVTDGYMKINQINAVVTITGNNGTADYDGKNHTVTGYTATADTALFDVTKDFTFSGNATVSRTIAGTTAMGLKADQFANTNPNFKTVTFNVTDGYMKINQIDAIVTITGNTGTADYDGKDHTVTGYVATVDTALFDVTKDFTFSGNATVLRKDAGTTAMGLKAEQFANTNPNFKTVTFNVTDGYIKINQIDAVVTITGNASTVNYDGKDHTVTGYTSTADTALYNVTNSFTFSGNATASRTVAGNTAMGLKANQFVNTNPNFKTVTFNVTDGYIKINQIDAVVTITGNASTVDYDGKAHTVTGYVATADTALYNVTNSFTFSGNATVSRTVAGTTAMGIKADQFVNTNPNFKTVTFNVTDGYMKINQINAVVTITGNYSTVNYDGKDHTVTGYTAKADTALYDVTKDFTFSGNDKVSRKDAGTTNMGLKASQFMNSNANFKSVTFNVTDGYIKINVVDSRITNEPVTDRPIYDGSEKQLVVPGTVDGGTVYYALGKDPLNSPSADSYSTDVPTAKESGYYYVWYKVVSDSNHNDIAPECIKVTLAEEDWVTLSGVLYSKDGKTPIEGAVITLEKGNNEVDYVITKADGKYEFTVPAGVYNIVVESQQISDTTLINLLEDTTQDVVMSGSNTGSALNVDNNGDDNFGVAVGGLNEEAAAVRKAENIPDDKNVSVLMTVELKTDETANNADKISAAAKDKSLIFFDITVEKTVDEKTTVMSKTNNIMEIAVPYEKVNKRGLAVYYSDGSDARVLEESTSKEEGTYYIDKENGYVYIYVNSFATFAIGYTPYYSVNSVLSLGSFNGTATVTIIGENGTELYKLENVAMDKINFADIPKGHYTMSVTWMDGVENTLTVPLTIGDQKTAAQKRTETEPVNSAYQDNASLTQILNKKEAVAAPLINTARPGTTIEADSIFSGDLNEHALSGLSEIPLNTQYDDRLFIPGGDSKRGFMRI